MNSDKYKPIKKKTQHLRFMMSYLDNEIGDCSEDMKESIDKVWDAIDELEKEYED